MSERYNSHQVGQRVQQTKKEIEQLKEELQKLINKGGQANSTDINDDRRSEVHESTASPQFTSRLHSNVSRPSNFRNITVRSNPSIVRSDTKRDATARELSPKKVRHYNVEEAREYIRKQKEKRLEQMKTQLKESRNIVDDRKVKLMELERKSRELVQKNVIQKRERSRSRDNTKVLEQERNKFNDTYKNDDRKENVPNSNIVLNHKTRDMLKHKTSVPDLIVTNLKVNSKPQQSVNAHNQVVVADKPVNCLLSQDAAATKIQQYFRKYRKRKLDRQMCEESLQAQKILEYKLKETIEFNRKKKSEVALDKPIIENVPSKQTTKNEPSLVTQTKFEVPIWLQPKVEPYPYNFISAVKRKLNFAVSSPAKPSCVVQAEPVLLDDSKINIQKVKDDIKTCIEDTNQKEVKNIHENLGSFLSKRCLNLDLRKVENLHLLKESNPNDCDIKNTLKPRHSTDAKSETSESDTSKYIPDISTETSVSKFSSLSTVSNSKSNVKLHINTDKIKGLKLEARPLLNGNPTHFDKKIEKLSSKSAENISKRHSSSSGKSKSLSNVTDLKNEQQLKPSPLHVPKLNLIEPESVPEESNSDLKSFLDYMSNLSQSKKSAQTKSKSEEKRPDSFVSLPQTSPKTDSVKTVASEKTSTRHEIASDKYSSSFSGSTSSVSAVPSLKHPSVALPTSHNIQDGALKTKTPISIKAGEVKCIETKTNTNQIHLKFEAELHLLNDFNESLRQFMAVEKTILDLHSKSQTNTTILQNQDTQTSAQLEDDDDSIVKDDKLSSTRTDLSVSHRKAVVPTINYSRGSDVEEDFDLFLQENSIHTDRKGEKSLVSTSLNLSQLDDTVNSTVDDSMSNVSVPCNESYTKNMFAGVSVGMFDQLIKDEDTRIENLKTILKIREKALLDRTKGELAWLEIQKKQLIETGKLHEASLLKKKQRGIIIKLQHEKQEMQRLKQVQKQASKERKTVLKEQRNMIKAQLSNNYMIPKIKRSAHRDRRQSGPVKVYNVHRETINTETSISRRNSVAEEIIITSRSESVVDHITEDFSVDQDSLVLNTSIKSVLSKRTEDAKKSLLMREAALQRRKKAAEDLLQWHQRLLEEERKIAELEMAANTIIKQAPSMVVSGQDNITKQKHNFKGSQLNLLWTNMTSRKEKKFKDDENYSLSQASLEKFCKEAKRISDRNEKVHSSRKHLSDTSISTDESNESKYSKKSTTSNHSIKAPANITTRSNSYTSDFESQEIPEDSPPKIEEILDEVPSDITPKLETPIKPVQLEIDKSKSTLNEIMQNISNITDEISAIYKLSTVANSSNDAKDPGTIQDTVSPTKSKPISSSLHEVLSQDRTSNISNTIQTKSEITSVTNGNKSIKETKDSGSSIEIVEDSVLKIPTTNSSKQISSSLQEGLSEDRTSDIYNSIKSKSEIITNNQILTNTDQSSNEDKDPGRISSENLEDVSKIGTNLSGNIDLSLHEILSQEKTNDISSTIKSKSDILSDKMILTKSDMDVMIENDKNKSSESIRTKPCSDESNALPLKISEMIKTNDDDDEEIESKEVSKELKATEIPSELNQDTLNILSQRSSDLQTDITQQLNDILSEGTKRINSILSTRSHKTSPSSIEDVTNTVSINNKLLDTKGSNLSSEKVNNLSKNDNSIVNNIKTSPKRTEISEFSQDTMNLLSQTSSGLKTDMDQHLDNILSEGTKRIHEILNSRSHSATTDIFTEKKTISSLDDNSRQTNISPDKILTDTTNERPESPTIPSKLSNESDGIKLSQSRTLSEPSVISDFSEVTNQKMTHLKADLDIQLDEILSEGTKRISNILSSRSQRSSTSIVTESDTLKRSLAERKNISNESITSDVKEISKGTDLSNDMLNSANQKISDLKIDMHHGIDEISSEGTKRISDIPCTYKSTSNISESDHLKTKSPADKTSISSITSIVKEIITDDLDKTNDILSEEANNHSENNKIIKSSSQNIKSTEIQTEVSENLTKPNEKSKSISATVLKSNDSTDTIRTKNESLNSSVQFIKTLTESVKTNDEIECTENSFPRLSKNTPPDSLATSNSSVKLSSNELGVEINYAGGSQNNVYVDCQMGSTAISKQKSSSIETEKNSQTNEIGSIIKTDETVPGNKSSKHGKDDIYSAVNKPETKLREKANDKASTLSEMSSMKDEENTISNRSIFKSLKTSEEEMVDSKTVVSKPETDSVIKTNEMLQENKISKHSNEDKHSTLNKQFTNLQETANAALTLSEMSSMKDDDGQNTISNHSGVLIFKPLKTSEKGSIVSKLEEMCRAETESKIEAMNEINSQISNALNDSKINGHGSESKIKTDNDEFNKKLLISSESIIASVEKEDQEFKLDSNKSAKVEDDDTTASSISTTDELSHTSEFKLDNEESNDNKIDANVTDTINSNDSTNIGKESVHSISEQLKSNDSNRNDIKSEVIDSVSIKSGTTETTTKERNTSGKDSPDFVDVKKRVSEILADANTPRGDKSPRLQDIYTTTYDILSPDRSPEMGSPVNSDKDLVSVNQLFGEEAEALLRKQLAIEQEIKQLEQQTKEQIPYLYMREIPNKPPPPYTPPQPQTNSIVPASVDQLDNIVCSLSRILHISYFKGTLETSTLSERDKRTFTSRNDVEKECYEFVFDICKELAVDHYKQFKDEPRPSWMKISKKSLAPRKPFNELELREYLFKETKVFLGFEKVIFKENVVTKWSRKKRDHEDEILVMESQAEESEWTNYDEDEIIVKDELTNDIMNMLLTETAHVMQNILRKKSSQSPS